METMRTKQDIIGKLEKSVKYYETRINGWKQVKRATKKDGTDFANFNQNFVGADLGKYYPVETEMHPYLSILFRDENGKLEYDQLRVYFDERDKDFRNNPDRKSFEKISPFYATERLTPTETMQQIEMLIEKYEQYKADNERELALVDKYFEMVEQHCVELETISKELKSLNDSDKMSSSLDYALKDYIKHRIGIF